MRPNVGEIWRSKYTFGHFRVLKFAPRNMVVCERVWQANSGRWCAQINPRSQEPRAPLKINAAKFGTTYQLVRP